MLVLVYNRNDDVYYRKEFIMNMYDIIIIGGGAAGLSCAMYACRGGMKTLVLEAMSAGGQMNYTYDVDNYPGFYQNPTGAELSDNFLKHAQKFGAQISTEKVKDIVDCEKSVKKIITRRNEYETRTIVFATGAVPRKLSAPGEDAFSGLGVSYCATCDGAFFKGQSTVVVGGGNTAFEDALYLSRFSSKVYLVHRSQKFRASQNLIDKVKANGKITIITDSVVEEIKGMDVVKSVMLKNTQNLQKQKIETSAVFVAVGRIPQTDLAGKFVNLTNEGFIVTDREMRTNIRGVYAAGDVRDTPLRQVITAAADGAVAAVTAINYING